MEVSITDETEQRKWEIRGPKPNAGKQSQTLPQMLLSRALSEIMQNIVCSQSNAFETAEPSKCGYHDAEPVIRLSVLNTRAMLMQALAGLPVSICWHPGSGNSRMRNISQLHDFTTLLQMAALSSRWWQQRPWSPLQGVQKRLNRLPWEQLTLEMREGECGYLQHFTLFPKLTVNWISAPSRQPRAPWGAKLGRTLCFWATPASAALQLPKGVPCCRYLYELINAPHGLLQR